MVFMRVSVFPTQSSQNSGFLSAVKQSLPARPRTVSKGAPVLSSQNPHLAPANTDRWTERFPKTHQLPDYQSNIVPATPAFEKKSIPDVAQDMAKQYTQRYGHYLHAMRQGLQSNGIVSGRAKTAFSIADKLRRMAAEEDRKWITAHWAHSRISDGLGFRLTLKQGSPADVDACVKSLAQLIRRGEFQILEMADYHGLGIPSYLSDHHIRTLRMANAQAQQNTSVCTPMRILRNVPEAVKKSGYTAFQMKIRFPDGTLGELQIRGPQVEKIATIEHLVYDIRRQKTLPGRHSTRSSGANRNQLEALIRSLDPGQTQDYLQYLSEYYLKARQLELGQSAIKTPDLPDSVSRYAQLDLKRIRGSSLD